MFLENLGKIWEKPFFELKIQTQKQRKPFNHKG